MQDVTRFDSYPLYQDMTRMLQSFRDSYPQLCELHSLGQSPEGREMWIMQITAPSWVRPESKPGFYIDGNHHAGEVTGSVACLYTIHRLLNDSEDDPRTAKLLRDTTFYIRPRVSPDGAEKYLTTPHHLRSVPRPYPRSDRQPGIHPEDIDGDGHIALMRIESPAGEWKASQQDPRIMLPRQDDETGGTYYHVVPEGRVYGSPDSLQVADHRWGLDLNRNYPANWQPEHIQSGSGPYPLSEPETRATADFLLDHPNIGMIISYHTSGHFLFRPPSTRPADSFSSFDIDMVYGVLGDRYSSYTGGPVRQSYDEESQKARPGSLMDWAFQHLGLVAWVPELWKWGHDYDDDGQISEADLMRWNDEELDGEGFINWREFDHPQLGAVEIGGWKTKFTRQNPPGRFLLDEIRPHYHWSLYLAESLPRLSIEDVQVQKWPNGSFGVAAVVGNPSLLPTNLTNQALRTGRLAPNEACLTLQGGNILSGSPRQKFDHLPGRISRLIPSMSRLRPGKTAAAPRQRVEWVVDADTSSLTITVQTQKAGTDRRELQLN